MESKLKKLKTTHDSSSDLNERQDKSKNDDNKTLFHYFTEEIKKIIEDGNYDKPIEKSVMEKFPEGHVN